MTILAPQDPTEIEQAVAAMIEYVGPVYMRIGNDPIPELNMEGSFVLGQARQLRTGNDVTIISTGTLTHVAVRAADILSQQNIDAEVLGMGTVWPCDSAAIIASATKTGRVVTVEEHYVTGGLGTIVQETLSGYPIPVTKLGIPHQYTTTGPYQEVLAFYGLDENSIAERILKM